MNLPLRIRIVGWYLIISGVLSLITIGLYYDEMLIYHAGTFYLGILQSVIVFSSGVAILRKVTWGKKLYLISAPIFMVILFILTSTFPFTNLIAYLIIFFLLTKKDKR